MLDRPGTGEYCEEVRPEDVNCATSTGGGDEIRGGIRDSAVRVEGGVALC